MNKLEFANLSELRKIQGLMANSYGFYGRLSAQFPSQVIVDVTEVCNLACVHCPHPEFKKSEHYSAAFLPEELNRKIVHEVRDFGAGITQYIRYTSAGEPLAHPKIYDMMAYAKKVSGTLVALTTNGKTMFAPAVEKLLDCGVDLVDVSIDAFLPETYAAIRVGGKLEVTRANVLKLIERRSQRGQAMKIVVSFVEQPNNTHEVASFEEFWKAQGADYVVIRRLHSAAGHNPSVAGLLRQNSAAKVRTPCVYPWERIVLGPLGNLSFCPADWNHGSTVIDYRTTTVKETWSGEFYRALRQAHLSDNYSCHKFCGQCPDWSVIKWPDEGRSYADMVDEFRRQGAEIKS